MGKLPVAAATSSLLLITSVVLLQVPLLASAAFIPKIGSYGWRASTQKLRQDLNNILKKHGDDIADVAQNFLPQPSDSSSGSGRTTDSAPATTAGLYVANLLVGTPAQTISGVLDISSQLVWMQCAPCTVCLPPPASSFFPSSSTTAFSLACNNNICQNVVPQTCNGTESNLCGYFAEYSNTSTTEGYLALDTFTFGTTAVANMLFGCSESSTGIYSGASGVFGLGRGELSLVSQLGISSFSYFLAPNGSAGSSDESDNLIQLGGVPVPPTGRSTPLYSSSAYPDLYYVRLTGVYVDGEEVGGIPAGTFDLNNDGSGGVFLSTTVSFTYLLSGAYTVVRQAFASRISAQPLSNGNLDALCYTAESMSGVTVPGLTLAFAGVDGGGDVTMELSTDNYFFEFNDGEQEVECLAVLPSVGASLLGSLLQTGTTMIYDLDAEQLTFVLADAIPSQASEAPAASLAMAVAVAVFVVRLFI